MRFAADLAGTGGLAALLAAMTDALMSDEASAVAALLGALLALLARLAYPLIGRGLEVMMRGRYRKLVRALRVLGSVVWEIAEEADEPLLLALDPDGDGGRRITPEEAERIGEAVGRAVTRKLIERKG